MEYEQAVEELLKTPFVRCEACDGAGGSRFQDLEEVCGACKGHGRYYRPKYLRACETLNLEPCGIPPSAFQRESAEILEQMHRVAGEAQRQRYYHDMKKRTAEPKRELPSFFPSWAVKKSN